MENDKFQAGRMYFIGGYHDPQRIQPCVIAPVIYLGKKKRDREMPREEGFEIYEFEELEAWLERKGQGQPDSTRVRSVEGPPEITLVMDIDQLIADLNRLRAKLSGGK